MDVISDLFTWIQIIYIIKRHKINLMILSIALLFTFSNNSII
jgi:hypothetical protein